MFMYVLDTLVTINMVTRVISSTDIEDVKENWIIFLFDNLKYC